MNFFNLSGKTVHAKTVELKNNLKKYYGIGTNKDTGKQFVLDYEGKTRKEAQGYFEVEFASHGAKLDYVVAYSQ